MWSSTRTLVALLACAVMFACAGVAGSAEEGKQRTKGRSAPSSSVKSPDWFRLIAIPHVGELKVACKRGQPFRAITRYVARNATQRARYVTSKGAKGGSRFMQPGQRVQSTTVGKRGTITWYVKQITKPETIRLRISVHYKVAPAGCYHVPVTRVARRSIAH